MHFKNFYTGYDVDLSRSKTVISDYRVKAAREPKNFFTEAEDQWLKRKEEKEKEMKVTNQLTAQFDLICLFHD